MLSDTDLSAFTDLACRLADAAGAAALPYFRARDLGTDDKGAGGAFDPVTVADRAAEGAIRAILAAERPDDGILGEEEAPRSGTSGLTWVVDPIDGTRAFISGTPTWGVLIACGDADGPQLGIIDQPYIGERFLGGFGRADLPYQGGFSRRVADVEERDFAGMVHDRQADGILVDADAFPGEIDLVDALLER